MTGYVLDDTLLAGFARGSNGVALLIASLDVRSVRMWVPAAALVTAQLDLAEEQRETLNAVVARLPQIRLESLADLDQVSAVAVTLGLFDEPTDMAAAHGASVSRRYAAPILTLDRSRWSDAVEQLPWRVELISLRE